LNGLAASREVNDCQSGMPQADVHFWR
jgi:hypothetical protein